MAGDLNEMHLVLGPIVITGPIVLTIFIPAVLYWKRLKPTDIDPKEDLDISFKGFLMFSFRNLGAIINNAISICLIVHAVPVIKRYECKDFRSLTPQPIGVHNTVDTSFVMTGVRNR